MFFFPLCISLRTVGNFLTFQPYTDYVFMAGIAYSGRNATETELENWFGEGKAKDETDQVEEIRDVLNITSAVKFKLFSFPETNTAYVSIRGTINNWDMLTDAQLWSAAALMQLLREMLPFGNMWSPVIDQLIMVMTKIESASIEKVSFYRDTTKFVNFLKVNRTYAGLGITGHSLGAS
jgi:lipase ATG15